MLVVSTDTEDLRRSEDERENAGFSHQSEYNDTALPTSRRAVQGYLRSRNSQRKAKELVWAQAYMVAIQICRVGAGGCSRDGRYWWPLWRPQSTLGDFQTTILANG